MHISFLKKKIVDWNCGNGIAEIGGEKIVAIDLWNRGKKVISMLNSNLNCKDRIWDGPKLGLDFSPMSPNNEFIKSG